MVRSVTETTTHDYLCEPATVAGLASTYYNENFASEDLRVLEACRNASARFRAAVRHHVTDTGHEEFTLDGTGTRYVQLPVLNPVIERVSIYGKPAEARVSRRGILEFTNATPRSLGAVYVSILSSGVGEVPDDIAGPVAWAALMRVGHYPGVTSLGVGSMSATFGSTAASGVSEEWSQAVANYQIQVGDRA